MAISSRLRVDGPSSPAVAPGTAAAALEAEGMAAAGPRHSIWYRRKACLARPGSIDEQLLAHGTARVGGCFGECCRKRRADRHWPGGGRDIGQCGGGLARRQHRTPATSAGSTRARSAKVTASIAARSASPAHTAASEARWLRKADPGRGGARGGRHARAGRVRSSRSASRCWWRHGARGRPAVRAVVAADHQP